MKINTRTLLLLSSHYFERERENGRIPSPGQKMDFGHLIEVKRTSIIGIKTKNIYR